VAVSLVSCNLFRLQDGNRDDETARRLVADYRAC
jgi:hypothetical protein